MKDLRQISALALVIIFFTQSISLEALAPASAVSSLAARALGQASEPLTAVATHPEAGATTSVATIEAWIRQIREKKEGRPRLLELGSNIEAAWLWVLQAHSEAVPGTIEQTSLENLLRMMDSGEDEEDLELMPTWFTEAKEAIAAEQGNVLSVLEWPSGDRTALREWFIQSEGFKHVLNWQKELNLSFVQMAILLEWFAEVKEQLSSLLPGELGKVAQLWLKEIAERDAARKKAARQVELERSRKKVAEAQKEELRARQVAQAQQEISDTIASAVDRWVQGEDLGLPEEASLWIEHSDRLRELIMANGKRQQARWNLLLTLVTQRILEEDLEKHPLGQVRSVRSASFQWFQKLMHSSLEWKENLLHRMIAQNEGTLPFPLPAFIPCLSLAYKEVCSAQGKVPKWKKEFERMLIQIFEQDATLLIEQVVLQGMPEDIWAIFELSEVFLEKYFEYMLKKKDQLKKSKRNAPAFKHLESMIKILQARGLAMSPVRRAWERVRRKQVSQESASLALIEEFLKEKEQAIYPPFVQTQFAAAEAILRNPDATPEQLEFLLTVYLPAVMYQTPLNQATCEPFAMPPILIRELRTIDSIYPQLIPLLQLQVASLVVEWINQPFVAAEQALLIGKALVCLGQVQSAVPVVQEGDTQKALNKALSVEQQIGPDLDSALGYLTRKDSGSFAAGHLGMLLVERGGYSLLNRLMLLYGQVETDNEKKKKILELIKAWCLAHAQEVNLEAILGEQGLQGRLEVCFELGIMLANLRRDPERGNLSEQALSQIIRTGVKLLGMGFDYDLKRESSWFTERFYFKRSEGLAFLPELLAETEATLLEQGSSGAGTTALMVMIHSNLLPVGDYAQILEFLWGKLCDLSLIQNHDCLSRVAALLATFVRNDICEEEFTRIRSEKWVFFQQSLERVLAALQGEAEDPALALNAYFYLSLATQTIEDLDLWEETLRGELVEKMIASWTRAIRENSIDYLGVARLMLVLAQNELCEQAILGMEVPLKVCLRDAFETSVNPSAVEVSRRLARELWSDPAIAIGLSGANALEQFWQRDAGELLLQEDEQALQPGVVMLPYIERSVLIDQGRKIRLIQQLLTRSTYTALPLLNRILKAKGVEEAIALLEDILRGLSEDTIQKIIRYLHTGHPESANANFLNYAFWKAMLRTTSTERTLQLSDGLQDALIRSWEALWPSLLLHLQQAPEEGLIELLFQGVGVSWKKWHQFLSGEELVEGISPQFYALLKERLVARFRAVAINKEPLDEDGSLWKKMQFHWQTFVEEDVDYHDADWVNELSYFISLGVLALPFLLEQHAQNPDRAQIALRYTLRECQEDWALAREWMAGQPNEPLLLEQMQHAEQSYPDQEAVNRAIQDLQALGTMQAAFGQLREWGELALPYSVVSASLRGNQRRWRLLLSKILEDKGILAASALKEIIQESEDLDLCRELSEFLYEQGYFMVIDPRDPEVITAKFGIQAASAIAQLEQDAVRHRWLEELHRRNPRLFALWIARELSKNDQMDNYVQTLEDDRVLAILGECERMEQELLKATAPGLRRLATRFLMTHPAMGTMVALNAFFATYPKLSVIMQEDILGYYSWLIYSAQAEREDVGGRAVWAHLKSVYGCSWRLFKCVLHTQDKLVRVQVRTARRLSLMLSVLALDEAKEVWQDTDLAQTLFGADYEQLVRAEASGQEGKEMKQDDPRFVALGRFQEQGGYALLFLLHKLESLRTQMGKNPALVAAYGRVSRLIHSIVTDEMVLVRGKIIPMLRQMNKLGSVMGLEGICDSIDKKHSLALTPILQKPTKVVKGRKCSLEEIAQKMAWLERGEHVGLSARLAEVWGREKGKLQFEIVEGTPNLAHRKGDVIFIRRDLWDGQAPQLLQLELVHELIWSILERQEDEVNGERLNYAYTVSILSGVFDAADWEALWEQMAQFGLDQELDLAVLGDLWLGQWPGNLREEVDLFQGSLHYQAFIKALRDALQGIESNEQSVQQEMGQLTAKKPDLNRLILAYAALAVAA